jgi:hypothetical protein
MPLLAHPAGVFVLWDGSNDEAIKAGVVRRERADEGSLLGQHP